MAEISAAAEEAAKQAATQNNEIDPPSAEDTNGSATGSKINDFGLKIKAPFWTRGLNKWIFGDSIKNQLIEDYKATHSGDTSEKAQEDAYTFLKMLENQYGYDDDELNEVSQQFLDIQGMNKSVYDTGRTNAAIDYLYGVDTKIEYKKNYEKAEKKVDQYVRFSNWDGQQNDEFAAKIMFDAQNDGLKIRDLNILANRLAGVTNDKEQTNDYANENLYKYLTWKDPEITALDEIDAFCNSFTGGLTDSLKGMGTSLMKVVGAGDLIPKDWQQPTWQQKKIADVKEHTGFVGDLLLDVSYGVGNMAPSLVANAVLPGSGLVVTFVGSAGQSYNQAIMQGHTETEATTYALLNAGLNTLTEKAFGFFGKGTKGFNAVTKLTSTFDDAFRSLIKNDAVRVVTSRVLSSGTGEFADEYFAQMLSPAVENIAFDGEEFTFKNNPIKPFSKENLYAGLVASFIGGALGGGEAMTHLNSAVDLDARMFDVKKSGQALGVSDKNIRLAQDAAGLSGMKVLFTDGETGFDADSKTVYINKDTQTPATEFGKMIGSGVNAAKASDKQGDVENNNSQNIDTQKNVHKREDLIGQDDSNVYNLDEAMTKKYGEYLKAQGFSENGIVNLIEQSAKNRTSKQSAIEHIMQMQKDMGDAGADVITDQKPAINNGEAVNQFIEPKISFTDTEINKLISENAVFSDEQLNSMDNKQLYHVLRTLSFENEGKIPDLYDKVLSLKDAENIDGMKSLVKELQGDRGNNMVLQNGGDGGRIQIKWDSWQNYEKIIVDGQQYAKVGNRFYSRHAVDRMQPSGNRFGPYIYQAGGDYGRSVAPQFVEYIIRTVEPVIQENGNLAFTSGNVKVITNQQKIVVTIITFK